MQTPPPFPSEVAKLSFFLFLKDVQCSETYSKTMFPIFLNFFVQQNFHSKFLGLGDFLTIFLVLLRFEEYFLDTFLKILRKWKKKSLKINFSREKNFSKLLFQEICFSKNLLKRIQKEINQNRRIIWSDEGHVQQTISSQSAAASVGASPPHTPPGARPPGSGRFWIESPLSTGYRVSLSLGARIDNFLHKSRTEK